MYSEMNNKTFISNRFFTAEELELFKSKFGYCITEISYFSTIGEIDFSNQDEKDFLFANGYPKISARFFA